MANALSLDKPIGTITSMEKQHINMGIDDMMYQLSKQLANVIKPMVHIEFQQAEEFENVVRILEEIIILQ